MRNWTDEKIREWNLQTFERDPVRQLNKVEEELLEVEKAKRAVYNSQSSNFNEFYQETADAYIAAAGLSTYPEYAALSRLLRNKIYSSIGIVLDNYIDAKMEENIKRTFERQGNVDHHI